MTLIPISNARSQLPSIVARVNDTLERVLITVNGRPKAVVVSFEELESLEETAEVLGISGAKASILRGLTQAKKKQGIKADSL